jgi:hypothetical protein
MLDSPLKYRREQRAHLLRFPRPAVGDGDVHVLAVGDVVRQFPQTVPAALAAVTGQVCVGTNEVLVYPARSRFQPKRV